MTKCFSGLRLGSLLLFVPSANVGLIQQNWVYSYEGVAGARMKFCCGKIDWKRMGMILLVGRFRRSSLCFSSTGGPCRTQCITSIHRCCTVMIYSNCLLARSLVSGESRAKRRTLHAMQRAKSIWIHEGGTPEYKCRERFPI
ncbi:hypothetical protein C8R41DRAFT_212803 [Lentinula lateritia]|uniref:Secreted protein n=1 Tax=Lentinula lateritia TaxID=40482 RepID=A0ABQ8VMK0_9AGAR|nr:hypothetical protein C8R41DRAFT_212803 [Lentinula lateritia]